MNVIEYCFIKIATDQESNETGISVNVLIYYYDENYFLVKLKKIIANK